MADPVSACRELWYFCCEMKIYRLLLVKLTLLVLFAVLWERCSKSTGFINTSLVKSGVSFYPVSNNLLVDTATGKSINGGIFTAGDTLSFEVDYFSQDSVKEVDLYAGINGADSLITRLPYSDSYFSFLKLMDTVLLRYAIPTLIPSGSKGNLIIQIMDANSLEITRNASFGIQ